jgi:hypothetical protein
MALTKVSNSMITGAAINVLDYASLAQVVSAKSPSDPASHLFTSFLSWRAPIQAALDAAYNAGGGAVVLPKNTVPYYLDDAIVIKDNTSFICEDWLVLADYTTGGGSFGANGSNIYVENLQLDNSNIYAGGSGQNGIGAGAGASGVGKNIKFSGGIVKNCSAGFNNAGYQPFNAGSFPVGATLRIDFIGTTDFTLIGAASNTVGIQFLCTGVGSGTGIASVLGDGGKGVQIEPGDGEAIVIDGMTFSNCFMAMSTIRDFGTVDDYYGIVYSNITADNCNILFFVRQANGAQDPTGLRHTVQLNNFYAVNCGTFEGVIQLSRASNVMVSNGVVVTQTGASAQPLVRGNHANSTFTNIGWYGDTNNCINLDPSTYAPDSSQANKNNRYDIEVWGQVNIFADASTSTPFRTLDNCAGNVTFRLPPALAFFGFELRNGGSVFNMNLNSGPFGVSKFVQAQTGVNYYSSSFPATFEGFEDRAYSAPYYASAAPTTGTHFVGKLFFNSAAAAGGFVGWVCTTAGTFGSYAEGLTVTSTGTATVTLSGANTELKVGMYLTINGTPAGKILSISGTTMIMSSAVGAGAGLSIAYTTPVFKTFGVISA